MKDALEGLDAAGLGWLADVLAPVLAMREPVKMVLVRRDEGDRIDAAEYSLVERARWAAIRRTSKWPAGVRPGEGESSAS